MAATPTDPLWINVNAGAPSYTANELRTAFALGLMYDGRRVGGRKGVRPGADQLLVSYSAPTITVQPGVCALDPGLTTTQGPYWGAVLTADTFTLTAADPTNPRKDIVIARVYDHDEDASGLRRLITEYLVGTPAGSPVEPTTPGSAIKLALLDVPASPGAVVVTDTRPWTVAPGGILPVRAAGDIAAGTAGRYRHRLDTSALEVDNGSAWVSTGASPRMGCSLRRVANQTLPDSAFTDVSWDTEDADTHSLFAPTSTTITIPTGGAGIWAITTSVIAPNTTSQDVAINAAGVSYSSFPNNANSVVVPLAASDTITVSVFGDSAAGTTMTGRLHAYRVGP